MKQAYCPNCFDEGFNGRCSSCDYIDINNSINHLTLPHNIILSNRYLVGRILGIGGFGATYLAKDLNTNMKCAIKEYLPSTLATRDVYTNNVYPSSNNNKSFFEHGLSVFEREAEVLKKFKGNMSVVQVYDYFKANSTAYFVMEYLDGLNLRAFSKSMNGKIPVELANQIINNIANILSQVHKEGLLHRDISPENIFLTKEGNVKLIDFGSTRFFLGEKSQSLSVVLKPGFAPPEQYSSRGNQGPWTDIYALCATYYDVTSGKKIIDAPDRLSGQNLADLSQLIPIENHTSKVIMKGLELDYRVRYQNALEFLSDFNDETIGYPSNTPQLKNKTISKTSTQTNTDLRAMPYIQLLKSGTQHDKWIIPSNMNITIGRSSTSCNIIIDAPNVSRVHCSVLYDEKKRMFFITDLSTNGTLTNKGLIGKNVTQGILPDEIFYVAQADNILKVGLE